MLLDRGDTFMVIATKITLPTVDVVTDALSINKVFSYEGAYGTYGSHRTAEFQAVGYAMIFVMILSWIMTIPHFLIRNFDRKTTGLLTTGLCEIWT